MAKLKDATVNIIFDLQRQLLDRIDEATGTEAVIFEQFGETEETMPELEQLQNIRERATSSYSRLYTLLLRVYEFQPLATSAILKLLASAIEQAEATNDAAKASVQDTKRNMEFVMNQPRIPDPETRRRSVEKLREVCRQYDALNLLLDEAIAQVEADIRNSPLNAYRLGKIKSVKPESDKVDA